MYEATHVCKCVWRLKVDSKCLPQLLPASFIGTDSLILTQDPLIQHILTQDPLIQHILLDSLSLGNPVTNGISGGSPCLLSICMGDQDLNFGPQVCTPSTEPSPSLILLHRTCYKVCVRGMPLAKETFLDFTNLGAPVGENLPLPMSSCIVSLLCFSTVSPLFPKLQLACFNTEGHLMSYAGKIHLTKFLVVVWNVSVFNMIKLVS